MGMKFDVVVGNPPYLGGLHMKFLQQGFQMLKEDGWLVFVQPSTCFINNKKTNFSGNKIIEEISDHIQSIEFVNGNKIFEIGLFVPCSVTVLSKQKRNGDFIVKYVSDEVVPYSSVEEISMFPQKETVKSLTEKLTTDKNLQQKCNQTRQDLSCLNLKKPFIVKISTIRGNVSKDTLFMSSFWTFLPNDKEYEIVYSNKQFCEIGKNQSLFFEFDSQVEGENFIKYLKTNFARRALSLLKINQQIGGSLNKVPYLDFTQEWTDEKLFKEFKLTQDEIDFINLIPKYYD